MKFRSLAFRRFGSFDECTLTFPEVGSNLHIIFGPNEAGKSTALAGLGYFLFGFPTRATHAFRYPHGEQRIVATVVDGQGAELAAMRRRANRNSLRELDDKTAVPDDRLRELLGGLDRLQFDMLFGLNHAQLVEGGDSIASGQGSLGQTLFAAGAGLAGLRRIDKTLESRLEELFRRTGRNQLISTTLAQLKAERQSLKEKSIAIETWAAQQNQLEDAVAAKQKLEEERTELRREEKRLASYRAALPTMAALAGLEEQFRTLADAPQLPADFGETYRKTLEDLKAAEVQRDRHREDADRAQMALDAIPSEPQVLAEDQAILDLKQSYGAVRKADDDRDPLYARMREHQGEAHQTLKNYFKIDDIAAAESLRITQADQDRIRSLGEMRQGHLQAVQTHRDKLAQLEGTIAELERQLSETVPPIDESRLDALARELLREGPLEETFETRVAEFRREQKAADRDLAKLQPFWKGQLKQIVAVNPPPLERIAHFEARFGQLTGETRDIEVHRDQHAKALREWTRKLDVLEKAGHVPDEAELRNLRADRDQSIEQLAEGTASLAEVRTRVHGSDDLVDRMRRDATRLSERDRCRADLKEAEEEHAVAVGQLEQLAEQRAELLARWTKEWEPTGIQPGEPSAMRIWLNQWTSLRERVERLETFGREVKDLKEKIDDHKQRLVAALSLGAADGATRLKYLHGLAEKAVEAARATRQTRSEQDNRLRLSRFERDAEANKLAAAESRLAEWRTNWGEAVAAIGLTDSAEPTTANRYLDHLAQIFGEIYKAETISLRLKGMDRDRGSFVERLEALRGRLDGTKHVPVDPTKLAIAVDELVRRANDAKLRQREREKVESDLTASRTALADAEQIVARNRARMMSLCEQAGFAKAEELPELIGRAERRREIESRLGEERAKLRHFAGDLDLPAFLAAAAEARPTLEARLAEVQARHEIVEREIPERLLAADAARKQIDSWQKTSSDAADHQQTIESLLAQLREQATEYAAVHLARQTLRLTIERFRERRSESLLAQASRYFQMLTCGAFSGLDVDETPDGEPILIAERAAPGERVEIAGLSDGTRDQLFLALRLAGIEQHVQAHGPMPIVVDDILINFDDARSAATLECLALLSKTTQVLIFTHHAHVLDLAKRVAADAVQCHDLSKPPIAIAK